MLQQNSSPCNRSCQSFVVLISRVLKTEMKKPKQSLQVPHTTGMTKQHWHQWHHFLSSEESKGAELKCIWTEQAVLLVLCCPWNLQYCLLWSSAGDGVWLSCSVCHSVEQEKTSLDSVFTWTISGWQIGRVLVSCCEAFYFRHEVPDAYERYEDTWQCALRFPQPTPFCHLPILFIDDSIFSRSTDNVNLIQTEVKWLQKVHEFARTKDIYCEQPSSTWHMPCPHVD